VSRAYAALLAGALVLCGCSAGRTASPEPVRLSVFAASSLAEALPTIDPTPRYVFAGSDTLATQIREGARADVFASASAEYGAALLRLGLVDRSRVFATNRLVLIVSRSARSIGSVVDLRRSGVKLVVGAKGVPVGDYTRRMLAALGALDVVRRVVSEESDVKQVAAKVALGEADAGFVYATDVRAVAGKVRSIELPARAQPRIEYTIAVARAGTHPAGARSFVARVLGAEGRAALRAAGFGLP
jgi:molybdate transport system substrate-binding protein